VVPELVQRHLDYLDELVDIGMLGFGDMPAVSGDETVRYTG
jgi:hypothetical protein